MLKLSHLEDNSLNAQLAAADFRFYCWLGWLDEEERSYFARTHDEVDRLYLDFGSSG